MKTVCNVVFLVVILSVGILGCKGSDGPAGPAGQQLTGNLVGYIGLSDEAGIVLTNYSGILVTAEGTTVSSTTDSTGRWVLTGLKTGTYNIVFTKSGFAINKIISYGFVGGGDVWIGWQGTLPQLPGFNVATLPVNVAGNFLNISGTITNIATYPRHIILFFGAGSATSSDPAKYLYFIEATVSSNSSNFNALVDKQELYNVGILSGASVYIAAYGKSAGTFEKYPDIATGRYVYTALSSTPFDAHIVVP